MDWEVRRLGPTKEKCSECDQLAVTYLRVGDKDIVMCRTHVLWFFDEILKSLSGDQNG